ncbi:melatonin receptor type 1B-like [Paramacrobiotus metropolitanus]|uniref:melatonin receptor type 1B-like n=1 Tax=Paramacrobiotus metropolitanus TaxID=2943436 RepID=UPI0024456EE4|nr:melatonin receptor type 1B-like [Paramacrobiotus metropolitanus]
MTTRGNSSNFSNGFATNFTAIPASSAEFTAITVTRFVLNTGVVLIMLKDRSLHSSFNVYVLVLLCGNILYAVVDGPLKILTFATRWWLGNVACNVEVYCIQILASVILHTHVLISLNRLWALFWPVSYRQRHTTTVAWLICLGMVVYVHVFQLPAVIIDALYYRNLDRGCFFNRAAQKTWATVQSVWFFHIPIFFVPACYPLLLWKQLSRRKTLKRTGPTTDVSSMRGSRNAASRRRTKGSRSFIVTSLFTLGFAVSWMPSDLYYILVDWMPMGQLETLRKVQTSMNPLLSLLDPIFFSLTMKHLQDFIIRLWRKCTAWLKRF